jgi:hypothetical protein
VSRAFVGCRASGGGAALSPSLTRNPGGNSDSLLIARRHVLPKGSVSFPTADVGRQYAHVNQLIFGFTARQDISPASGLVRIII